MQLWRQLWARVAGVVVVDEKMLGFENMGDSRRLYCHDGDPHHEQEVPFLPSLDDEVAPSATDSAASTLSLKSQNTVV